MTSRVPLLAALVTLTSLAVGCGDDPAEAGVDVADAWALPTPAATTVGAVYFTMRAHTDDALVAVEVDAGVAAGAQLHATVPAGDGGATTMEEVPELELPAGEDVAIESGEYHVMLEDLAGPLEVGDTFEISLDFEFAPSETVAVEVREVAPGS